MAVLPQVRAADLDLLSGTKSDEGPGDDWPAVRRGVMETDILVIGTPICLGCERRPRTAMLSIVPQLKADLDVLAHLLGRSQFGTGSLGCTLTPGLASWSAKRSDFNSPVTYS